MDKKKAKVDDTKIQLEQVITTKNVMLRFFNYLIDHHAAENMRFWLEAQIFKYEKDQNKCKENANVIYERYFGSKGCGLNIEEEHLIAELAKKIKKPDRTIFMLVQNAIWGLLKLECFPRFRATEGVADKIKKPKLKALLKMPEAKELIELYDIFNDLNQKYPTTENGMFKATFLPNDAYKEHLHTTLPDIDELWKDRDLMLAFREYLYQRCARENLSFYVEAANYEFLTNEKELSAKAKHIFDKFIGPNATQPINLDCTVVDRLKKNLEKKTPSADSLKSTTDRIWKVLANEWFPEFVVSPLYTACNEETIVYSKSDGGRKRSDTMEEYELLSKRKLALEKKQPGKSEDDSNKSGEKERDNKSDSKSGGEKEKEKDKEKEKEKDKKKEKKKDKGKDNH